jgi:hypothetical protein
MERGRREYQNDSKVRDVIYGLPQTIHLVCKPYQDLSYEARCTRDENASSCIEVNDRRNRHSKEKNNFLVPRPYF